MLRAIARPTDVPRVLGRSGTAASVTGTLVETTLATIQLPAGSMGLNGQLRISAYFTITNSANNKTMAIKLGTSTVRSVTRTANANQNFLQLVANRGVANSQFNYIMADAVSSVLSNTTEDTAVDKTITFTGTLANTGETITLESYLVELIL